MCVGDEADEGCFEVITAPRCHQGRGRVAGQHGAGVHQRDPVASQGLVHEVGRDEDRHVLPTREVDEQFPELVAGDRIDARRGLVEDQHLRGVDHGNGERKPLPHAEGQHLGEVVEVHPEAEPCHQLIDPGLGPVGRQVVQPRVEPEVLADGELRVE